jgi:hypothetical protein
LKACARLFSLMVDPRLRSAGKAAINVWSGVVGPLVDKMEKWIPTEDERTEFTEAVTADMANPAYHLYSPMYAAALHINEANE